MRAIGMGADMKLGVLLTNPNITDRPSNGHPTGLELCVLAVLIVWSCLAFILPTFALTTDQMTYVSAATALLREGRLESADGIAIANRPLLHYLTALLLKLDADLKAYVIACQAGSFIFMGLGYYFVRRHFGWVAAASALAFYVSNPQIAFTSARHIDAFMPALVIASLIVWVPGVSRSAGLERPVLSGLLFGLAFAFKEVALSFLPLWLIIAAGQGRTALKANIRTLLAFYGSLGACVGLSMAWSIAASSGLDTFGGVHQLQSVSLAFDVTSLRGALAILAFPFVGLWQFLAGVELAQGWVERDMLALPALFAISWIAWTARRSSARLVLISLAAAQIPLLVISGDWQLRPGQTLLWDLTARICIAVALLDFAKHLLTSTPTTRGAMIAIAAVIGASQWTVASLQASASVDRLWINRIVDESPTRWGIASQVGSGLAEYFDARSGGVMIEPAIRAQGFYRHTTTHEAAHSFIWHDVTLIKNFSGARRLAQPVDTPLYVKPLSRNENVVISNGIYILDLGDIARQIEAIEPSGIALHERIHPGLSDHLEHLGITPVETVRDGVMFLIYDPADFLDLYGSGPVPTAIRPGVCEWVQSLSELTSVRAQKAYTRLSTNIPSLVQNDCASRSGATE